MQAAMDICAGGYMHMMQWALPYCLEHNTGKLFATGGGLALQGDPQALASALQKIEAYAKRIHNPTAERNPASGQLFIINPLAGRGADNLFSTHPATGNRVKALLALGTKMGLSPRPAPFAGFAPGPARTSVPTTPSQTLGPWG